MKAYIITNDELIKGNYDNKPLYEFTAIASSCNINDCKAELTIRNKKSIFGGCFTTEKASVYIYENEIVIVALDKKTKIEIIEYLLT